MENKIQVASAAIKGEWGNLKTPEGKEIGVMLAKAPKLKAQIEAAITKNVFPCEMEGRTVTKGDKTYGWDADEKKQGGGGFKGAPRDEEAIVAQSCLSSACLLYSQSSQNRPEEVLKAAEQFYNFVKSKSKKMQGNG